MKLRYAFYSLALASTFSLGGCALTSDSVSLTYEPQSNVVELEEAQDRSVSVEVQDKRDDTSRISNKRNGLGMDTASIYAQAPVEETVRKAIETELANRGFNIANTAASIHVSGNITNLYADHHMGLLAGDTLADFDMTVTVANPEGEVVYTTNLSADGKEENIQLMNGANAGRAIEEAISNGMDELFRDQGFMSALLAVPASN